MARRALIMRCIGTNCGSDPLRQALEILADMTGHPEATVVTAARTILRLTRNAEHSDEAFKALRMFDQLELIP